MLAKARPATLATTGHTTIQLRDVASDAALMLAAIRRLASGSVHAADHVSARDSLHAFGQRQAQSPGGYHRGGGIFHTRCRRRYRVRSVVLRSGHAPRTTPRLESQFHRRTQVEAPGKSARHRPSAPLAWSPKG